MVSLRRCVWTSTVLLLAASSAFAKDDPHWIWAEGERGGSSCVVLWTTFQASENPHAAELWLSNVYCDCEIFLNGESSYRIRPFHPPSRLALKPLRSGENYLGFLCRGVDGPSALAARVEMDKTSIVTDTTWHVTELGEPFDRWQEFSASTWDPATSFGVLDQRTWSSVGVATNVADDYTQWKRALEQTGSTAADQLEVQPGFQVERLYSSGEGEGGADVFEDVDEYIEQFLAEGA